MAPLPTPFPTSIDAVTGEWLTATLRESGALDGDGSVRAVDAEPIGVGVGLMGLLHRLRLDYDGAPGPATLVVKFPVPHPETRHVARVFRFYEKEVGFYRHLADESPFTTARPHLAVHDPETDDFALVLDDVGGWGAIYDQTVGCPPEIAVVAARALGRHAAAFVDHPSFTGEAGAWLPFGHDSPNPEGVMQGVSDAWGPFQERFPELVDDELTEIVPRYVSSVRELMVPDPDRPVTLAHGDYRLDNLFFAGDEVTAIDWQICAKAPCAYDLAYFVSQSLTVDDRRGHETTIIDAWFDAFTAAGGVHDRDDFMVDYRRSVMFCLAYPLQSAAIDLANERARTLVADMYTRCITAIRDHDATAFLA